MTTTLVLDAGGLSLPPIVYVTRFDEVQKRTETTIDLRRFIPLYNETIPPASRVGKPNDWRFDVVADSSRGLVMYVSSPLFDEASFQAKLPARLRHKRWIRLNLIEALVRGVGPTDQLLAFLPGLGSPLDYFMALREHASVRRVERVDGVETQSYFETVNLRRYLDELPRFLRKIAADSSPTMQARVWVDGSSTIRRIRLISRPIRGGGGGAVMVDTTDLRDLGGKITINLPPAQQVFDAAALGDGTATRTLTTPHVFRVRVFFCTQLTCAKAATKAQEQAVIVRISHDQRVERWRFVSKEAALRKMQATNPAATSALSTNPFPDSLDVYEKTASLTPAVGTDLLTAKLLGVERLTWVRLTRRSPMALAPAVQAAPVSAKVLGKQTAATPGVIALANTGGSQSRQRYSAFGFRIQATKGQQVTAHWAISCFAGSKARMNDGNVKLVGRGAVAVTFWRPPSLSPASYCNMDLIALRSPQSPGSLTALILGRS